jgi:hypothetical protein
MYGFEVFLGRGHRRQYYNQKTLLVFPDYCIPPEYRFFPEFANRNSGSKKPEILIPVRKKEYTKEYRAKL